MHVEESLCILSSLRLFKVSVELKAHFLSAKRDKRPFFLHSCGLKNEPLNTCVLHITFSRASLFVKQRNFDPGMSITCSLAMTSESNQYLQSTCDI